MLKQIEIKNFNNFKLKFLLNIIRMKFLGNKIISLYKTN